MKSRGSAIGTRESERRASENASCDSGFRISDPRSSARSHARGFTLIELIAVILLLAIAMTIVSISFSRSLQSAKIRAASRDLVAALRYTRGQAIVKGKSQALVLDLEKNAYTAPGKPTRELPKGMMLRLTTAESEVTAANSGGIRFFPDGSSTGGHIAVLQGQREWRINVAWLTGDIELNERGE
ncbi:MAG: GspH/FimT family pseudopilin [Dokdonella sp.]|nr:GspH/FimT family pseudopilin [Dokdonella sp.]